MFSLLRVSILTAVTAHVWAQSGNIFSVTSQVLGLSENDFKQNDNKELFDLMSKEDQLRYRELEEEGGKAYSFIVELWTRAQDAAWGRLDEQTAFQKISHFYDTMSDGEKRRLLHYFPTVAHALAVPSIAEEIYDSGLEWLNECAGSTIR